MKIDIHTHTKKCKTGDAPTREISASAFCQRVLSTEVKIISITNHNVFDLNQYTDIKRGLGEDAQVWPGIELDIIDSGIRGHLLVIVAPDFARRLDMVVADVTSGMTPDTFTCTIETVLSKFEVLKPLYIAHYKQKKPALTEEALEKLMAGTAHRARVIKEVTNAISAGIFISHGHASIYGSDVQDWANYENISRDLPDLRLPVESFEQFCLLLEKDPTTINTALNKKTPEDLILSPFTDSTLLKIKVFNDINVLFGSKGTGKSCILEAIARFYSNKGIEAKVYESASGRIDTIYNSKSRDLTINLNTYGVNYCTDEIKKLRAAIEVNVTSLSKYVDYFKVTNTSKNSQKLLLKDIEVEQEGSPKRDFTDANEAVGKTVAFLDFLDTSQAIKKELSDEQHEEVRQILSGLLGRLILRKSSSFSTWKEICLLNSAITVIRDEVSRKTGTPSKPTSVGFREYARNRIEIEKCAASILGSVSVSIPIQKEPVGNLGPSKGDLEYWTEYRFQTGRVSDSSLQSLTDANKTPQRKFITEVRNILSNVYSENLFPCITALNEIEGVDEIRTVNELLLYKTYFTLNGEPYTPSSGEGAMVMLQRELGADKEVYILDEPEKSLGNEYISDVIVPLLKERARAGKRVFISTHDANIAVRTLPYCSVFRCHGPDGYATYSGNPFSNNLVNPNNPQDMLDWKATSMRTLEGGRDAFGERGKIYGNV